MTWASFLQQILEQITHTQPHKKILIYLPPLAQKSLQLHDELERLNMNLSEKCEKKCVVSDWWNTKNCRKQESLSLIFQNSTLFFLKSLPEQKKN